MQTAVSESQYQAYAAMCNADATYEEFCAAIEQAVNSNNGNALDANYIANAVIESVGDLLAGYIKTNCVVHWWAKDCDKLIFTLDEPSEDGEDHTFETEEIGKALYRLNVVPSIVFTYEDELGNYDWTKACYTIERPARVEATIKKLQGIVEAALHSIKDGTAKKFFESVHDRVYEFHNDACHFFIYQSVGDESVQIRNLNNADCNAYSIQDAISNQTRKFATFIFKYCM